MELRRKPPSYTIDTIRELAEREPRSQLFFIVGADTIRELPSWRAVRQLLSLCTLLVAARPGYAPQELDDLVPAVGREAVEKLRLHYHEIPLIQVSSSDIRDRIKKGLSIRYMVPDPVEDYIRANRLYLP